MTETEETRPNSLVAFGENAAELEDGHQNTDDNQPRHWRTRFIYTGKNWWEQSVIGSGFRRLTRQQRPAAQ